MILTHFLFSLSSNPLYIYNESQVTPSSPSCSPHTHIPYCTPSRSLNLFCSLNIDLFTMMFWEMEWEWKMEWEPILDIDWWGGLLPNEWMNECNVVSVCLSVACMLCLVVVVVVVVAVICECVVVVVDGMGNIIYIYSVLVMIWDVIWNGIRWWYDMVHYTVWCILYGGTIICTVYTLWNIEGDNIFIVSIDLNGCHFNPYYHPNALTVYLIRHKEWNRKQNYVSPHTLVDEKGSGEGSRGHAPDTTLSLSLSLCLSFRFLILCVVICFFVTVCPSPTNPLLFFFFSF